jgi:regulator of RNase E activity RraA
MYSWIYKYACTGMFSDELDKMGYPKQIIAGLRPNNSHQKFYGPIRTFGFEMVETKDDNLPEQLHFIESLSPGDILCVEGNPQFAYFGEMMSRIAMRQKLGGVIIGGVTRDSTYTQNLTELLIFADGYSPLDLKGRGRVRGTDIQVNIKGVPVNPGDWAFADNDGIVIIPEHLRVELGQRIIQVIKEEADIVNAINNGASMDELLKKHNEF